MHLDFCNLILAPYMRASPTKRLTVVFLSPASGVHPFEPGRISALCSSLLDTSISQFLIKEESARPSCLTHKEAAKEIID